jgi:hypothetical protein
MACTIRRDFFTSQKPSTSCYVTLPNGNMIDSAVRRLPHSNWIVIIKMRGSPTPELSCRNITSKAIELTMKDSQAPVSLNELLDRTIDSSIQHRTCSYGLVAQASVLLRYAACLTFELSYRNTITSCDKLTMKDKLIPVGLNELLDSRWR